MVALRSRRLEATLGASLDGLEYRHIESLVTNQVSEEFDLDFKRTLYGNADSGRKALATDVAALANTAGGLLVLGIEEDRQARAVAAPGVTISDDELNRIRSVIGTRVVPFPAYDLVPFRKPGEDDHGFIVIAVLRSPLAPHAVIVDQGLRYPRRNGTTTRYLSEPEVATAYRDRFAGAQQQASRMAEVEQEAMRRLDVSDLPWVVVSLVPDLPGDLSIDREVLTAFQQRIMGAPATPFPSNTHFVRASVGHRRLLADGTMDDSSLARRLSLELHTDGSGVCSMCVADLMRARAMLPTQEGMPQSRMVDDESLVIAVMSGLLLLAKHARDRTAAGGNALIRAQIFPISGEHPTALGHYRHGFPDQRGDRALTEQPPAAEATAGLDDLAQPGRDLAAASALLVNEMGQAFGVAEMGQLSRDGQLRRRYWRGQDVSTWAEQNGIEVTDDTIA